MSFAHYMAVVAVAVVCTASVTTAFKIAGVSDGIVLSQDCMWAKRFSWPSTSEGARWLPAPLWNTTVVAPTVEVYAGPTALAIETNLDAVDATGHVYLAGSDLGDLGTTVVYWLGMLDSRSSPVFESGSAELELAPGGCLSEDTDLFVNGHSVGAALEAAQSHAPTSCQDYYMLGLPLPARCVVDDGVAVEPPVAYLDGVYTAFPRGGRVSYTRNLGVAPAPFVATRTGQITIGNTLGELERYKDVEFQLVMVAVGNEAEPRVVFEISGGHHGLSLLYGPGNTLTASKCTRNEEFKDSVMTVSLDLVVGRISLVALYFAETGGEATLALKIDDRTASQQKTGVPARWMTSWLSALWPTTPLYDNSLCRNAVYKHPDAAHMDMNIGLRARLLERR